MRPNLHFLILGFCAHSVLSAPKPFGPDTGFILAPRTSAEDWNTPRDNGSSFLAPRPNAHSAEWFNSRRKTRRGNDEPLMTAKRATAARSWQDLTGPNSMYSYPTGVSWGGQREDVFYHDRDGNVCSHFYYNGFSWSSEEDLGGSWSSSFGASCWGNGRIDLYGQGTDGACWHNSYSGGWNSWSSLGGNMVYDPSTVTWGSGRSDVFVISASDGACWHRVYSGGGWASWENIGGTIDKSPTSVTWGSDHISVFVKGTDGQCWHRMWLTSKGGWSNWEPLGGTLAGSVTAVAWGGNRIDIFVWGTDNHCWYRRYHGDFNSWDSWVNLGRNLAYPPNVIQYGNTLIIIIVERGGAMFVLIVVNDNWNSASWQPYGGSLASQPSGVVWGNNNVDIFSMGTDFSCERNFG